MYVIYDKITGQVLSSWKQRRWYGAINEDEDIVSHVHIFTLEEAREAKKVLIKDFGDRGEEVNFEIWKIQEYRAFKVLKVVE